MEPVEEEKEREKRREREKVRERRELRDKKGLKSETSFLTEYFWKGVRNFSYSALLTNEKSGTTTNYLDLLSHVLQ